MTTVQGVTAAVQGIEALRSNDVTVMSLQELDHAATVIAPTSPEGRC